MNVLSLLYLCLTKLDQIEWDIYGCNIPIELKELVYMKSAHHVMKIWDYIVLKE